LPISSLDDLLVNDAVASAKIIRGLLAGERSGARDIVILNAAAALWTAGISDDLKECATRAAEAIDSKAAQKLLEQLAEQTNA